MPIVTDGLLLYLNSKQGVSGSTWDNIAPSRVGQYNGTINGTTVNVDGMLFDGVDDYIDVPVPTELKSITNATFEFRLKLNNHSSYPEIFSTNRGNTSASYLLYVGSSSLVLSGMFSPSWSDDTGNASVDATKELYVTITADVTNGTIGIYTNGVFVKSESRAIGLFTSEAPPKDTFRLGTYNFSYAPNGIIDNIRLYNRVLTQAEITQNYNAGRELGLSSGQSFNISLNDTVVSTDTISKRLSVVVADTITTNEVGNENVNKNVSDSILASDTVSYTQGKAVNLSDSIAILDSISKSLSRSITDNVDLADTEDETVLKSLVDSIALSDSIMKQSAQSIKLYDVIVTSGGIDVFNPDAPELVGIIHLQGKRELYVYLQGKRDLIINLQGKRELFINLQGGLNMISNQNFSMVSGDTTTLVININENLIGATVKWAMKKRGAPTLTLTKNGSIVDGKIHIVLDKADTEELSGLFVHECEVTDQSGNVSTVTSGSVNILADMI